LTPASQIVFEPGDTSKMAFLPLCGDSLPESDETVNLTLTGDNLGTPSTAVLTVNDTASVFRNPTAIAINQNGAAGPYPSEITVAGGPQMIGSMRITLYDVALNIPDNMDVLLVAPGGQSMILEADAGGQSVNEPATLNFKDTAGQVLPDEGPLATGDFEPTSWAAVSNFPTPAPTGPYNLPGSTVGGTGTQTLIGNFGGTDSNGIWRLYVRDDTPSDGQVVVGLILGGWGIEFLGSTTANASISGRITTADLRGIRIARVVISGDSLAEPRTVSTGSFGYFVFEGLTAGETYVVTVNSQRYRFSVPSRVISLVDNVTDADFAADPVE
jgi:hypothetical protein